MWKNGIFSFLAAALVLSVGACRADEEAAQQMDPSPHPTIEQAPATPTPPVGVPPVGTPGAVERLDPDTLPRDTMVIDTPGAMPRVP